VAWLIDPAVKNRTPTLAEIDQFLTIVLPPTNKNQSPRPPKESYERRPGDTHTLRR
jgi:hypothetical protein